MQGATARGLQGPSKDFEPLGGSGVVIIISGGYGVPLRVPLKGSIGDF